MRKNQIYIFTLLCLVIGLPFYVQPASFGSQGAIVGIIASCVVIGVCVTKVYQQYQKDAGR